MLGVLKELKSWVKVSHRSSGHVSVDTLVSALHHHATFTILLICCALVTSRQYFGDPILCIQDSSNDDAAIPSNVLNTYCFVTSSYTVVGPTGRDSSCTPFYKAYTCSSIITLSLMHIKMSKYEYYVDVYSNIVKSKTIIFIYLLLV
jgi:hypothetical protein